jgi:hypothetical protein
VNCIGTIAGHVTIDKHKFGYVPEGVGEGVVVSVGVGEGVGANKEQIVVAV